MATAAEKTGRILLALAALLALGLLIANAASAGPAATRLVHAPGEIVPIPASIPHEEGDMVDKRILGDLRWIAARYPIYVTDGYSGPLPDGEHVGCNQCHVKGSDHYNGLAVDLVPLNGTPGKCDSTWAPITRLAEWAEPVQNEPVPPFRWVGYNGDAGHGCGNHLHLSWQHSPNGSKSSPPVRPANASHASPGPARRRRNCRPVPLAASARSTPAASHPAATSSPELNQIIHPPGGEVDAVRWPGGA